MASKVRPEPRYDARNLYRIKKVGSDLFTSQGLASENDHAIWSILLVVDCEH